MASRNTAVVARQRRRRMTVLWSVVVAAVVTALIYKEQIALLYVLASVGVTALLVVLMRADLSSARGVTTRPAPFDDAAAVGDGVTASNLNRQRRASSRR